MYRKLAEAALVLFLLALSGGAAWIALAFAATNSGGSAASSTSQTATGLDIPLAIDPVNPAAIPLGDGNLTTSPRVGYVDSCQTSFPSNQGSQVDGPWINTGAKTWDSETKLAVQGSVSWPDAYYDVTISGNERLIMGNDEPVDHTTGLFPISHSDPAYQYDSNPNHIAPQNVMFTLPLNPTLAPAPTCLGLGPIGILNDGVYLYNALDAEGRDAGAHEVLDSFQGHPDSSDSYHHHEVPAFLLDNVTAPDSATLVGYAADGFGIYVERDANGNLLTNANLDACHGRTSVVPWNGQLVDVYHYDATLEYPYTVGCYMGNAQSQIGPPMMTTTGSSSSAQQAPPGPPASTTSTTAVSSSTSISQPSSSTTASSTLTGSAETSSVQAAQFPLAALPAVLAAAVIVSASLVRRRST